MAKGNEMENGARRIPKKGSKIEAKEQIQQSKKANKNKKKINKSNNSTSSNGKGVDEVEPEDVVMVPDSENDEEDDIVVQEEDGDDVEEEEASRDGNGGGKEKEEEVTKKKKKKEKKRNKDGKRKTSEGDDDSSSSSSLCFPMNRISRIIKSEDADIRITQDSVFLINKATEKFLELFCKEAYACAVPDSKKQVWYKHLSSVVSKRKRFDFLLDIVPEKVKAEDALAEMSVGET